MPTSALKEIAKNTPLLRVLFKQRYDKRFANNTVEQLYRGIFRTALEASESFPVQKLGYDHPEPANMYEGLMTKIESYDYPVLFWLAKLLKDDPENANRGVFDYGGHIGI